MMDTRCPKCFRECATWAHVEDCDGSVTKPMIPPVVCAACGIEGHKADECPLFVEALKEKEKRVWEFKGEYGLATSPKEMWDRVMEWARDGWTMPDNDFLQDAVLMMDDRHTLLEELMQESVDNCPCKRENITPGCCRCETFRAALSSTVPCPHAEEAKRLREAVEWACEHAEDFGKLVHGEYNIVGFAAELRRRAGGKG